MNVKSILTRIGTIGAGHTMLWVFNNFFDFIVYGAVIAHFGLVHGFMIMAPVSVLLNLFLIKVYDLTGKDWLGAESVKEGKEALVKDKPVWLRRLIFSSDIAALILISIYDPFIAVIYLRKQEQAYKGLSKRDWVIFFISTIIANGAWSVTIYTGLSVIDWFLKIAHLS